MKHTRGLAVVLCLAGALASAAASLAHAQAFPTRPVRIIVAFPPGGPSDYAARVVSLKLPEFLGQQVVVDNRPGAGGALGTELVARAAPDGYTLVIGNTGTLAVLPHLQASIPYNALRDFTAITNLIGGPSFLLTHPSVPAKNLRELIALARKLPGQLTYASAGVGQISHMNGELLKQLAHIDLLHVPYKGTGPIMPEILGGQVSMTFSTSIDNLQFVKTGRLRGLAVTGKERLAVAQDLPTMAESGLPGFESLNWNGVVGPAGMPKDIVNRLNREIVRAINLPDVKEKIIAQGNFAIGDTPEEFAAFIRAESDKWARVVKQANIKLD
jgi:tripartite-type tricarboxylate transporter receptor subunit TctC